MRATFEQDRRFFEQEPVPGRAMLLRYAVAFALIGGFIGATGLLHATLVGTLGALFWLGMAWIALRARKPRPVHTWLEQCPRLQLPREVTVELHNEHLIQTSQLARTQTRWDYLESARLENDELRLLHADLVYRRIPVSALDDAVAWLTACQGLIGTKAPDLPEPPATITLRWTWNADMGRAHMRELRAARDPDYVDGPLPLQTRLVWGAMASGIVWTWVYPPVAAVAQSSAPAWPLFGLALLVVGLPITTRHLTLEHVNRGLAWLHSASTTPPTAQAAFLSEHGITWRGPDGDHWCAWSAVQEATFTETFLTFRFDVGQQVFVPLHESGAPTDLEEQVTTWLSKAHEAELPRQPTDARGEPPTDPNPFRAPDA